MKLKKGKDFGELASSFSMDPGSKKKRGRAWLGKKGVPC